MNMMNSIYLIRFVVEENWIQWSTDMEYNSIKLLNFRKSHIYTFKSFTH